jgi:hypothetical protein
VGSVHENPCRRPEWDAHTQRALVRVPADDKENVRLIVSQIILDMFAGLKAAYPKPSAERRKRLQAVRQQLTRQIARMGGQR